MVDPNPEPSGSFRDMTAVEAVRLLVAFWLADHRAPGWLQRLAAGLPMRRKWHDGWDYRKYQNAQAVYKAAKQPR